MQKKSVEKVSVHNGNLSTDVLGEGKIHDVMKRWCSWMEIRGG